MVHRRRESEGDPLGVVPYRRAAGRPPESGPRFDLVSFAADVWVALFFAVVVLTLTRWGALVDAVATFWMGFAPHGG